MITDLTQTPIASVERTSLVPIEGVLPKELQIDNVTLPPSDLYSNEPNLETDLHRRQIDLLIRLLEFWWRDRNDFYIAGNLTVHYSISETKKRDFRGPDIFIVLNAEKRDRRSWTVWEEGGKYPNVVIELLSTSTATVDRTTKKELYENVWRLPEYYWFDPESLEFSGFRQINGQYEPIAPNAAGHLISEELNLALGIHDRRLRWFTTGGELVPFPEEQERQAKERLEAFLRSQGIDPNNLPE